MKHKLKIIAIFLIIFQLILSSCVKFDSITTPNIDKDNKLFSKKSTPDLSVCNSNNFINIGISKYFIPKGSSENIIVTYNIPEKYRAWLELLNQANLSYPRKFSLTITEKGSSNFKTYQKDLDFGCNSFEWDGKDNNGEYMPEGKYYVNIVLSSQYNSYSINELIEQSSNYYNYQNGYFYCNGSLVKGLQKDKNCTNFITPDDFAKQVTSTTIDIVDNDPKVAEGTEFFKLEEFKTLDNLASKLTIDDYNANSLYNSYKTLESYKEKKVSINERLSQANISEETRQSLESKLQEIDSAISSLQSTISNISSSLLSELYTLNNNSINLSQHINTITEGPYITQYPQEDKPDSIGVYSDKGYFASQSVQLYLDPLTFYQPDIDNPNQDTLSMAWDVDANRVEALDPKNIFEASKYLAEEIQTAKDLITDIKNGTFSNSGEEGESEELQASEIIKNIVDQLKNETGILKTNTKLFTSQYQYITEQATYLHQEMQDTILLSLGTVIENIDDYDPDTFRLKAIIKNPPKVEFGQDIEKLQSIQNKYNKLQEVLEELKLENNITGFKIQGGSKFTGVSSGTKKEIDYEKIVESASGFEGSSLTDKEKFVAILLGIDRQGLEALKSKHPDQVKKLVDSFTDLTNELLSNIPGNSFKLIDLDTLIDLYDKIGLDGVKNKHKIKDTKKVKLNKKKLDVAKVLKRLIKIYEAIVLFEKAYDLYANRAAVKKAIGNLCYDASFNRANIPINKSEINCLTDLTTYLFTLGVNKELEKHYNKNHRKYPAKNILSLKNDTYLYNKLRKEPHSYEKILKKEGILPAKPNPFFKNYPWKKQIYDSIVPIFKRLISLDGIEIEKIIVTTERWSVVLYAPNFKSILDTTYVGSGGYYPFVVKVNNLDGSYGFLYKEYPSNILKNTNTDYTKANRVLIKQMDLRDSEGNYVSELDLSTYIKNVFVWHHHEDLESMVLLPKRVHNHTVKHWGSANILKKTVSNPYLRDKWKNSWHYSQ